MHTTLVSLLSQCDRCGGGGVNSSLSCDQFQIQSRGTFEKKISGSFFRTARAITELIGLAMFQIDQYLLIRLRRIEYSRSFGVSVYTISSLTREVILYAF